MAGNPDKDSQECAFVWDEASQLYFHARYVAFDLRYAWRLWTWISRKTTMITVGI